MAESPGVGFVLCGGDAMNLKDKIAEDESVFAIASCACGKSDCEDIQFLIRNPRCEPNPERPEELMCASRIPFQAIPGIVAALMHHYAEKIEADLPDGPI